MSISLKGKREKLAKAYRDNEEVSIRISHSALSGSDTLMVPMNTIKKLSKSKDRGKGTVIKISKANVRKQTGEGIFSILLPVLRTAAPTIGKTLGLSALHVAGLAFQEFKLLFILHFRKTSIVKLLPHQCL